MAPPHEALRLCLAEAVDASGPLLERSLEQAAQSLQEAQGRSIPASERQLLSDALHELQALRAGWIAAFAPALRAAIDGGSLTSAPPAPPRAVGQALTLVDEADVDQQLEAVRLSSQLQSMVDQPLGEFDALVSSALGLPAVRREQNPLRPEVFAQVLRGLLQEPETDQALLSLWTRHLAPTLGAELGQLYRRLAPLLASAGVVPVAYRMRPAASGPAPLRVAEADAARPDDDTPPGRNAQGSGAPGGAGAGPAGRARGDAPPHGHPAAGQGAPGDALNDPRLRGSALADIAHNDLGDELVGEFLRHGSGQGQAALAQGYYARVASELARIEAAPPEPPPVPDTAADALYRELPVVERAPRAVSTDTPLNRAVWGGYGPARERSLHRTRLKKQAQQVDQVLGLELVRKLVNQVAADPRLLGPVRESIIALEPSLLRLALVQPRFFSDDHHPGRCLVERVAARSLRFNDEYNADFGAFASAVAAAFNALNANEAAATLEFTATLAALEGAWSTQDAREALQRDQALVAVRFAEERQLAANQIAQALAQRPDLTGAPRVVQDFIYRPWALVMAQARLSDSAGQIDPGGHGSLVTDLLWSVKPSAALRQPARLMQLIPGLLQRLRAGLALLGQTPQDCADFFQTLEELHRPVLELRARRRGDADPAATPPPAPLRPPAEAAPSRPAARRMPAAGDAPWMARRELAAAGFASGGFGGSGLDSVSGDSLISVLPQGPDSVSPPPARLPAAPTATTPAAAAPARAPAPAPAAAAATAPAGAALAPAEVAQLLAGLQEGCWVDLCSEQRWLRVRLAWSSKGATLFMFVGQGGQPHSMTRRTCERLLRERLLRPVQMHGVVAHAIGVVGRSGTTRALAA